MALRKSIIVIMSIYYVCNSGKLHGEKTFINSNYYIGNKTAFHRSREIIEYYNNTDHIVIASLLSFKIINSRISCYTLTFKPIENELTAQSSSSSH